MSDPETLAVQLIEVDVATRATLLEPYRIADHASAQALALALKQAYDDTFSHDLVLAAQISALSLIHI